MSTKEAGSQSPRIESRDDLVRWIAAGEKPASEWRIGTEHEKFVFHLNDFSPVPYEGPAGIQALMETLIADHGWQAIKEGETIIALKRQGSSSSMPKPFPLSPAANSSCPARR